MAKFNLDQTGNTNIQTDFRFEVIFGSGNSSLGVSDNITGYCTSAQLPKASLEALVWHLPMGMQNHQAGRASIQPISLEFVVSGDQINSAYAMFEKWRNAGYNLNTGKSKGKAGYSIDNMQIILRGEDNSARHTFKIKRAFATDFEYGTVSSESGQLLKVSMTLVYDNYEVNGISYNY